MSADAAAPAGAADRAARAIPRATYRLQLHAGFGFAAAEALLPYLDGLGISHLYVSPLLRARPGSPHGYDVVDHGTLNPELGSRADFDSLVAALHARGMGLVVDVVPNHMGVLGGDNAWWLDVLENGQASAFAGHFDIDWNDPDPVLNGKVLLPILGDAYGIVLERGELRAGFDAARGYFTIDYFEHRLPLDPSGYGALLRRALRSLPADAPGRTALQALAGQFDQLPPRDAATPELRRRRQADKSLLKARLAAAAGESAALRDAIGAVLRGLNGSVGRRASFDALHELIDAQAYRLSYWRVAGDEINYRRFFDINELAALRQERDEVFEATHGLILDLAAAGAIDGLRIDHPDGLADPEAYFGRLQTGFARRAGLPPPLPADGDRRPDRPIYVVAEKIVAAHEQLPRTWAVHGTTGYRFANVALGLLIDGRAKARLDRVWRLFVRDEAEDFETLAWRCRRLAMADALAGQLTVLAQELLRLAREDRRTRDFTLASLRRALAEVVAAFPVYRTYVVHSPSAQDRRFIDWAVGVARSRNPAVDASVFAFIRRVLLGRPLPGGAPGRAERFHAFTTRLQQYTAPVAAKGIEDTALYRHHRLIACNDVGGDPDLFGLSVTAFHAATRDRDRNWPQTMLATSTHDAKRSEDIRLRLAVISEMPAAWRLATRRWSRMNRRLKRTVDGAAAPSRNDEYLLYQLLAGTLPDGELDAAALGEWAGRVEQAMLKAARESKRITSWIRPHAAYENALAAFVRSLLAGGENNLFLADLRDNVATLSWFGALNGLTLAVVKALSPGVPDYYQGHEAIELAMADPDNRRPVDFDRRARWLADARALLALPEPQRRAALAGWLATAPDGRAKFWVGWRALALRREHEAALRDSVYVALDARGRHAAHVVAFARRSESAWLVVVATRLAATLHGTVGEAPLGALWEDTVVEWPAAPSAQAAPADSPAMPALFTDSITGRRHAFAAGGWPLRDLLTEFPVAALYGALPGGHEDPERRGPGAGADPEPDRAL